MISRMLKRTEKLLRISFNSAFKILANKLRARGHLGGESYFLEHSDERDIRLISADVVSFWCPGVKNAYPRTRRAQDTGFQKKSIFLKKSLRKIAVRVCSGGDF